MNRLLSLLVSRAGQYVAQLEFDPPQVHGFALHLELHDFACRGFLPDRTLILMLEEGQQRARARDGAEGDRIGGRPDGFHHRVDLGFRLIAAEEPDRVRLIDASGSQAEVTGRLLHAIEDLLP